MICSKCKKVDHDNCDDIEKELDWVQYCMKNDIQPAGPKGQILKPYRSCDCLHRKS